MTIEALKMVSQNEAEKLFEEISPLLGKHNAIVASMAISLLAAKVLYCLPHNQCPLFAESFKESIDATMALLKEKLD